jgi:RNA polymerase sigma-70 factor (ECF subfamily)
MPLGENPLLKAAAEGNGEALAALLREHGPVVRRRLHIDPIWQAVLDPADVMQVTYLEAFLRIDHLQARTTESFVAWLTQLAQNNLRDGIKELERQKRPNPRQRVRPTSFAESASTLLSQLCVAPSKTPSRAAATKEAAEVLTQALAKLPPPYAEALRLHDLEGRAVAEVAEAMGRSRGAVCMLRLRALDQLRSLMGSESKFFSDGS